MLRTNKMLNHARRSSSVETTVKSPVSASSETSAKSLVLASSETTFSQIANQTGTSKLLPRLQHRTEGQQQHGKHESLRAKLQNLQITEAEHSAHTIEPEMTHEEDDKAQEDLEIIELLMMKAEKESKAGHYDAAERIITKVLRRYQTLAVRYPIFNNQLADMSIKMAMIQMTQGHFDDALVSLNNATVSGLGQQQAQEVEVMMIKILMQTKDYDAAMSKVSKSLIAHRRAHRQRDERYYEMVALKGQVFLLMNELDEAEAYFDAIPSSSKHYGHPAVEESLEMNKSNSFASPIKQTRELQTEQTLDNTSSPFPLHVNLPPSKPKASLLRVKDFYTESKDIKKIILAARTGSLHDLDLIRKFGHGLVYEDQTHGTSSITQSLDSRLHVAARHGNIAAARELISQGSIAEMVVTKNKNEVTPLLVAAKRNQLEMARLLIENGASVNLLALNPALKYNWTALHWAVYNDNASFVEMLLSKGALTAERSNDGETPLLLSARLNRFKIANILCKNGAKVDTPLDKSHITPLHLASQGGYVDMAKMLCDYGANVNALKQPRKVTPLHLATIEGTKVGASIGYFTIASALCDREASINAQIDDGETALSISIRSMNLQWIKYFLGHNASLNTTSTLFPGVTGVTPLHSLVIILCRTHLPSDSNLAIINLLVEHGVDINARNSLNSTPLNVAVDSQSIQIAELLLKLGADVHSVPGRLPTHKTMGKLLKKYGWKQESIWG